MCVQERDLTHSLCEQEYRTINRILRHGLILGIRISDAVGVKLIQGGWVQERLHGDEIRRFVVKEVAVATRCDVS